MLAISTICFFTFLSFLLHFKQSNPLAIAGQKQQVVGMKRKGGKQNHFENLQ